MPRTMHVECTGHKAYEFLEEKKLSGREHSEGLWR